METIIVGVIAFIGGYLGGRKARANAVVPVLNDVSLTQTIDRANYLHTLRRELANILVWRNPQRYLELYRQIHTEILSLKSWRAEEISKRLVELSLKYPNYSDFDFVGTREYILYPDGVSMYDNAELEKHYHNSWIFVALSVLGDDNWKDAAKRGFVNTTSEEELTHLTRYVQRIEDTKFEYRIQKAIYDYHLARKEFGANLNNGVYEIVYMPHFDETLYGVHLKVTNEYGIYSHFVFDDGRSSQSCYRSNSTFELEQPLDSLRDVLREIKLL